MKVHARIITDYKRLSEGRAELDAFLKENSPNPFLFLSFIENLMRSNATKDQVPVVIVVRNKTGIIGVAPLALRSYFGIRYAELMNDYWASPDFVLRKGYEHVALETAVEAVFGNLKARFVVFDLNEESRSIPTLIRLCRERGIPYFEHSHAYMTHGVVKVDRPWHEYKRSCGHHLPKDLRSVKNRLDRAGKWKLVAVEGCEEGSEGELYQRLQLVEKSSWKEHYRHLTSQAVDESIRWFLDSSASADECGSILKRKVWFLEMEGRPIAYVLVFQHGDTAYIMKTSFDERYRKTGAGKYAMYAAMRDLFDANEVREIDFMTNLPMVRFWRADLRKRIRLRMGSKVIVSLAEARSILREGASRLGNGSRGAFFAPTARTQLAEATKDGHA